MKVKELRSRKGSEQNREENRRQSGGNKRRSTDSLGEILFARNVRKSNAALNCIN